MISTVPSGNTRYKGRVISGFYHDPQGKKQAFCRSGPKNGTSILAKTMSERAYF